MDYNVLFWFVPAASLLALTFAWYFYRQMKKESEGTERMAYIAEAVRKGAMAYLKQQYKVVTIVFVSLALIFRTTFLSAESSWASHSLTIVFPLLPVIPTTVAFVWSRLNLANLSRAEIASSTRIKSTEDT